MRLRFTPPLPPDPEAPTEGRLFATVARRPNLAADVIEQVEAAIVRGDLAPGDRLPPERVLTERFGVSRTVIREAIHALTAKNLIEAQPGARAVVARPNTQTIAESLRLLLNLGRPNIEFRELVEVRRTLEAEVAQRSAERRQREDLDALQDALENMRDAEDADAFTYHDMRFHLLLAEASHNRLYVILLHALLELVTDLSLLGSQTPRRRRLATDFHSNIFDRVEARDGDGARAAMLEHLEAFGAGMDGEER